MIEREPEANEPEPNAADKTPDEPHDEGGWTPGETVTTSVREGFEGGEVPIYEVAEEGRRG